MKAVLYPLLIFLSLYTPTLAQNTESWDVADPPGNYREHTFDLAEGTWMNLDLSPDGQTLVFDLLGEIYRLPLSGGEAEVLRSGLPWEVQPRFSPDGQYILFTSDAGGGDNLWVMDRDGQNARAITEETFRLLNNGVWMPDGQYIVARKHYTSERSLGAGELWMYHRSGGAGIQITKRKNDQQDLNEPCVSPDGRYIYYSEDVYPGGYFQYNKDPNSQIYVIKRYDRQEGRSETVVRGPGGAVRPQLSHDGQRLAFVRRIRTQSVLFIHHLETGEEYPIYEKLSKDQQEAWAIFGCYPGFAWTPDDREIIIWAKGKLRKINVADQTASTIPFSVRAEHRIADIVRFQQPVAPNQFTARAIRQAVTAPDGQSLVFNAVGQLWRRSLPEGRPERLTQATDLEFEANFSPDGQQLVYVTWTDEDLGALYVRDLQTGVSKRISEKKGIYRTPSFSPDGQKIVFRKEGGNGHQGFLYTKKPGLYWIATEGGPEHFICAEGQVPQFSADGQRIFYQTGGFIFGSIALWIFTRIRKLDALPYLDAIALGLPLAQAIGRWGNFINQELYGPPTTLPWGLRIDRIHRIVPYNDLTTYPASTRFHPLFLYESLWNFLGFALIFWLSRRFAQQLKPGDIALMYLIWYPLGRFFIEFLRTDSWFFAGTSFNVVHILTAIAVLVGSIGLYLRHRSTATAGESSR